MADGRITEVGSYNELVRSNGEFAQFLQTYKGLDDESDSDKVKCVLSDPLLSSKTSTVACNGGPNKIDDEQKPAKNSEQRILTSREEVQTNCVTLAVISAYCRACTWCMTILVLFFTVMSHAVSVATNLWLAEWSSAETDNVNTTLIFCENANSPEYVCGSCLGGRNGLKHVKTLNTGISVGIVSIFHSPPPLPNL